MAHRPRVGDGHLLIIDTGDGRQYVGQADGAENLLQRWDAYATNGHRGNVELRGLDPAVFRLSVLRVFNPAVWRRTQRGRESLQARAGTRVATG